MLMYGSILEALTYIGDSHMEETMGSRLDVEMVRRGLAASREKAKEQIKAGYVFVDGVCAAKAGMTTEEAAVIESRAEVLPYVSRGGLKLAKAIESFSLSLAGKRCMDIGASTGGFTDCMLQNGAAKIYAVDVGHDQLAPALRADARVVCMEGTNIRYVQPEDIGEAISFASVDVSFISLTLVLPVLACLLEEGGEAVCLVKPQFEAGRDKVGKKGVVRDAKVHREVLQRVMMAAQAEGFFVLHLAYSPVKGPEGNIEYLMHVKKKADDMQQSCFAVEEQRKNADGVQTIMDDKQYADRKQTAGEEQQVLIRRLVESAHAALGKN